jgi:hypothetical protein
MTEKNSENPNTVSVNTANPIPTWFTGIAVFVLLWNLLGVMAFAGQMLITPEMLSQLPQAEQDLYAATPLWATIAFAIAVIAGAIGAFLLFLKKSACIPVFQLSLVGVVIQMVHSLFLSNSLEVYGPGSSTMPMLVVVIAITLVWWSKKSLGKGWLS